MKQIFLMFGYIVCIPFILVAQPVNEARTLFGNGNPLDAKDVGFFVAPSLGITQMDASNALLFNIRGGIDLKDKLSFGTYYSVSMNQIKPRSEIVPNVYMDYWSVGGFGEYTLLSKKLVHVTFPIYMGFGEVQMDSEIDDVELGEANFFQIEPSAMLEVNLHKYVRFSLGAGYRIVNEMQYRNLNQSDLSGFTGYVGLKFGLFR
jgi:hypothetical protein